MIGWIFVGLALFVLAMLAISAAKARNARLKLPLEKHQCVCRRKDCDDAINTSGITRKQYFITFQAGEDEIRCAVPHKVFEAIEIGAEGELEHRGTYFVSFTVGEQVFEE